MRVVLVGELNPYGGDPRLALWPQPANASGARLCRVLGLHATTYVRLRRVNLCVGSWRLLEARRAWDQLLLEETENLDDVCFVLLGRRVQRAANARGTPLTYDVQKPVCKIVYLRLPHPSGRCLAWNNPETARTVREILRELVPEVSWGEALERPDQEAPSPG